MLFLAPALKALDKLCSHFRYSFLSSSTLPCTTIMFFLTCFFSYAGSHKVMIEQSELLLDRAKTIIANDLASEYSLKLTRSRLVSMRGNLVENEKVQLNKVKNLTDQIEAMDSPLLEGEIMSDQLSELRERLKENLAKESFPLAFSRSARERAEQYIVQIDSLLLERFKSKLLSKKPSPLNILAWGSTASELSTIGHEIVYKVNESVANFSGYATANIMTALFFLALGLSFFWLKKFFNNELDSRLEVANSEKSKAILLVLKNLNHFIPPVIGYLTIFHGLKLTGIFGEFSELFFDYALGIIITLVVARWLVMSLASKVIQVGHLFNFGEENERKAVRLVAQLAISFSAILFVDMIHKGFNLTEISQVNLYFPIVIVIGLTFFHLSRVIKTADNYDSFASASPTFSKIMSKSVIAITIVIPVFAALGYIEASLYFSKGIILSFAVIGGAYVGYRVLVVITKGVLIIGDSEDKGAFGKLLSSLIGLAIGLLAIMVCSLVWGLGINNLQDIWFRINEGVPLGDSRITPAGLVKFIIVFVLGYIITRFLQGVLRERILPSTNLDAGGKVALLSGLGYVGYFLAGIIALSSTGLDLSSLAILAGALSVGLGFGMQTIVSNFVSGIIMLIERPIKEGDWIEVSGYSGTVKAISVRSTHLQTFNKATAIIPNSAIISSSVLNWMHGDVEGRVSVPIEVAYGTDPNLVKRLLLEIASGHSKVLDDPEPVVLLRGFGESALKFELRAFISEKFSLNVQSELNFEVLKVFEQHDIEIPYPKRDLNLKIDSENIKPSIVLEKNE